MVSLRNYLKEKYPDLSNRLIKKSLEMGACSINGKIERYASREINPHKDKVVYRKIKEAEQENKQLIIDRKRIIFEDDHLLIYDKEGHYPSLETSSKNQVHLLGELKKQLGIKQLYAVHRLDKGTSGLIIFAKSSDICNKLTELFSNKEVKKEYLAFIDGILVQERIKLDNELVLIDRSDNHQKWAVKNKNSKLPSKRAITELELIENYKDYAYIKLKPFTGRTHQLRVHTSYLGHPILGDTVYGSHFKCKKLFSRHLLHAYKLSFKHPISGTSLHFEAELPEEFKKILKNK